MKRNFSLQNYPPGQWDQLAVVFLFNRKYGFYILQAYVPAYITVFMSWVSFFLGAGAIPARTMVGVNALLALTFQVTIFFQLLSISLSFYCPAFNWLARGKRNQANWGKVQPGITIGTLGRLIVQ